MAGRLYAVEFHNVAIAAQQDLFYIKPAADKPVFLEFAELAVVGGAADAGDAQEELLDVEIIRLPATVTVGSGGGAMTPNPLVTSDTAAGATARINDTTKASSSGTAVNVHSGGWNSRVSWLWTPQPDHRPFVGNAQAMVVRLNTTPADSIACNGTLLIRELG